jgi:hydroxymethylbilane synthase
MDRLPLRLGTRRSPLALAQAQEARSRLCAARGWCPEAVELVTVLASGDRFQDRPLPEIGGKALWTRELDAWLVEGRIDAAVHSLKDVETLRPAEIVIGAVLPREDVRDVLVGASSVAALAPGARIGTSAPRRAAQMLHARPDLTIVPLRGNVATRIAKLAAGEADATLLAAAGLARLGETGVGTPLAADEWLPAAAQGAIGIECRAADAEMRAWLAEIDHAPSRAEIAAERALLAALGGTCHSPVAVITAREETELVVRAAVFSPDGAARFQATERFAPMDAVGPARLAEALLSGADTEISRHFSGPRTASA